MRWVRRPLEKALTTRLEPSLYHAAQGSGQDTELRDPHSTQVTAVMSVCKKTSVSITTSKRTNGWWGVLPEIHDHLLTQEEGRTKVCSSCRQGQGESHFLGTQQPGPSYLRLFPVWANPIATELCEDKKYGPFGLHRRMLISKITVFFS